MKKAVKFKISIVLIVISCLLAGTCIIIRYSEDRTPPQIYFENNLEQAKISLTNENLLNGVYAEDDISGDVSNTLKIEKIYYDDDGNACVVYVAKDENNNVVKQLKVFRTEQIAE